MVVARQLSRRFSNAARSPRTWVYVNHFKLKQTQSELFEFLTREVPTISTLKEKIATNTGFLFTPNKVSLYEKDKLLDLGETTPTASKDDPLLAKIELSEAEERAKLQAEDFIKNLMNIEPEKIPIPDDFPYKDPGMRLIRDLPLLTGDKYSIVLREDTQRFWQDVLDTVKSKSPVCAVGSPGIGKTSTIPVAIKHALLNNSPITFLLRSPNKTGHYYQFQPSEAESSGIRVDIFPESAAPDFIPTMDDPAAFLFIDPGKTKDTCDWAQSVKAKVVIVCSPDSRHWGGNEFLKTKAEGGLEGNFRYYNMYSLPELLIARSVINPSVSADKVKELYQLFGGSPRRIFAGSELNGLNTQAIGLQKLTNEICEQIVRHEYTLDTGDPSGPDGSVLAMMASNDFKYQVGVPASRHVESELGIRLKKDAYFAAIKNRSPKEKAAAVERFFALLLLNEEEKFTTRIRPCVGKRHRYYTSVTNDYGVGGCRSKKLVGNIFEALAREDDLTLLMSYVDNHVTIDMAYREENVIHAFNVTTQSKGGKGFLNTTEKMRALDEARVAFPNCNMRLYLATTEFDTFVTSPVEPVEDGGTEPLEVMHLEVIPP